VDRWTRHHDGRFAKAGEAISVDALHREKQAELAAREAGSSKGGATTMRHPLFAAYISHLKRKGSDPKTCVRNRHAFARFETWLTGLGLEPTNASEPVIEEYFDWLSHKWAQTTANREAPSTSWRRELTRSLTY
jgi:hypothetical protein